MTGDPRPPDPPSSDLLEARAAHARRDWPRARDLFLAERALARLSADDLYALSDAAWWLGDNALLFDAGAQAYDAYLAAGRPRRAAIAATDIAAVHFLAGEGRVGSGWISRAQRLLEAEPEAAEHGYLAYMLEVEGPLGGIVATDARAFDDVIAAARRVQELGRRHGDATLVAAGTLGEGRALVKAGQVDRGLALLDEALLAVRGDALVPAWAGNIYCNLIAAAEELGDFRRARAWTDAMTRWLDTMPAAVVFRGICRVHRARILELAGAWDEAESEAARVCQDLGRLDVAVAARAHYQVGEIRRMRGDAAAAEHAYRSAQELGRDPQPGLALLRLAQGRADVAAASLRSALLAETNRFLRAGLLAAQVEVALALRDLDPADQACAELDDIAAQFTSSGLRMAAARARGDLLLARQRPADALPILRDACRTWSEVDAPYECARVRVLLARAYQTLGDGDSAARELDIAVAVFQRLGAAPDAGAIARLGAGRTLPGGLTAREAEVLAHVAAGHTNKAIARALGLSEKTVARHLANIYGKLGVRTRTAAAAFAFEHSLAAPLTSTGDGWN
jgi:DNA-binding CsgD family transcriptional regulator